MHGNEPELLKIYEREFGPFIHMSPIDKSIWLRFLMHGGSQFAPFNYDVRVGRGLEMPDGSNPFTVRAAYALTTKRIDAIATIDGDVVIIEVKQRAGLSCIGQLIGYRDLYLKTISATARVKMWLVTDELQPDMSGLLLENNIRYFVVGQ